MNLNEKKYFQLCLLTSSSSYENQLSRNAILSDFDFQLVCPIYEATDGIFYETPYDANISKRTIEELHRCTRCSIRQSEY